MLEEQAHTSARRDKNKVEEGRKRKFVHRAHMCGSSRYRCVLQRMLPHLLWRLENSSLLLLRVLGGGHFFRLGVQFFAIGKEEKKK